MLYQSGITGVSSAPKLQRSGGSALKRTSIDAICSSRSTFPSEQSKLSSRTVSPYVRLSCERESGKLSICRRISFSAAKMIPVICVAVASQSHLHLVGEQRGDDELQHVGKQVPRGRYAREDVAKQLPAALLARLLHVGGRLLHQEAERVIRHGRVRHQHLGDGVEDERGVSLHGDVAHVHHHAPLHLHRQLRLLVRQQTQRALRRARREVEQLRVRLSRATVSLEVHHRELREGKTARRGRRFQLLVDPVARQNVQKRTVDVKRVDRVVLGETARLRVRVRGKDDGKRGRMEVCVQVA